MNSFFRFHSRYRQSCSFHWRGKFTWPLFTDPLHATEIVPAAMGVGCSATKPMPTMPTNTPCHVTGVNPEFVVISRPVFTNLLILDVIGLGEPPWLVEAGVRRRLGGAG
jgi:hypothetical protein